ncbi:MAG: hypothetical protein AAF921_15000 [Cyanobacteria bacterium P01_D01_bin.44]
MFKSSADTRVKSTFANGQTFHVLDLPNSLGYQDALLALGLQGPVPSAVIIGGASNMSPQSQARLLQVFTQVLAPLAESLGITVFDGGTDAGVIHMMGQARHHIRGSFNLVGVVPRGKAQLPERLSTAGIGINSESGCQLEPHHTHFVLIPGDEWGSESKWLAEFASILAGPRPSITLLINGGKISLVDLQLNLAAGREAIVLSGSGRLADKIAKTIDGTEPTNDLTIQALVKEYYPQQLTVFDLSSPLESLNHRLEAYFRPAS